MIIIIIIQIWIIINNKYINILFIFLYIFSISLNLSLVINGTISSSSKGSFLFWILILFNSILSKWIDVFLEKVLESSLLLILCSVLFSNFFGNSFKLVFTKVFSLVKFLLLSLKLFTGGVWKKTLVLVFLFIDPSSISLFTFKVLVEDDNKLFILIFFFELNFINFLLNVFFSKILLSFISPSSCITLIVSILSLIFSCKLTI